MWRILIFAVFTAICLYYATLVLHLIGIIRIGNQSYKLQYLIPFWLWFE